MDIKQSEIKHILDERRAERTMEKVGIWITGIILGVALALLAHAWIISLTLR
jgi:hypothetical protein